MFSKSTRSILGYGYRNGIILVLHLLPFLQRVEIGEYKNTKTQQISTTLNISENTGFLKYTQFLHSALDTIFETYDG